MSAASYLPTAHAVGGLLGLALALALFFLIGAGCGVRDETPEVKVLAGWGLVCLVLTAWGVATVIDLRWPLALLAVGALAIATIPAWRARIGGASGVGRVALLSLPLWLVMLPLMPSEIDTWLNLLPNAAYLFDYGMLPTDARPPSYSFLPVAPYNTQFAAFAASVFTGSLREGVMGLFNIALLCAAGLGVARVVANGNISRASGAPPWWACALGLLIVVPLNPGFVPRVFMSPYGEASLAVTVMFAVMLATDALTELRDAAWPRSIFALALVLAAMVNIKQSGLGLVLPVGATMLAIGLADRTIANRRVVAATVAALAPALGLYFVWRLFATTSFPEGELKLLPWREWNWPLLPAILAAMLHALYQKAAYTAVLIATLVFAAQRLRTAMAQRRFGRDAMLLAMTGGIVVLFNGFLLFTYVAHFPPNWALDAHSYFRYASQLSLAVMLALVVALRPFATSRLAAFSAPRLRSWAMAPIALTLVLPLLGARLLRFDLDTPQPELRQVARDVAEKISPGDRLALLLPDDRDDADGSMLRGLLLFTPPRRPRLEFRIETKADAAMLASVAADGISLALVSCTSPTLADAPPGVAALLRYAGGAWRTVEMTRYPPDIADRRFLAMLQRGPVCGERKSPAAKP